MRKRLWCILTIVVLMMVCGVNAYAESAEGDTVKVSPKKWYTQINNYKKVVDDTAAVDSFKTVYGKQYWMLAASAGKLDLTDETVDYPGFVGFCVDVYNWCDRTFCTFDTAYVVGTGKNWKLQIKNDNWMDFYHLKQPGGLKMNMASDVAPIIGVSIAFMAVSVGYSVNLDKLISGEPVTHKRLEFGLNSALVAFDAYYTKNRGNTNIHKLNDYSNYNLFKTEYNFSGMSVDSYGIDLYYFFNNKKYSQAAAYSYSKYQKRSAGSMIGGVTLSRQDVNMDFSALPENILKKIPEDRRKYHVCYNDYCVMLGYGYNCVLGKNWLLNTTVIPCFGFNHSLSELESERIMKDKFSVNVKAKLALVYNHNRFYYSLNGRYDGHFYNAKDYQFVNSYTNLTLLAGFRF